MKVSMAVKVTGEVELVPAPMEERAETVATSATMEKSAKEAAKANVAMDALDAAAAVVVDHVMMETEIKRLGEEKRG